MNFELRLFNRSIVSLTSEKRSASIGYSDLKHPKQWLVDAMRGLTSDGKVGTKDALSFSGYYGAVKILSETMGIMPFNVYRRENGRRKSIDCAAKRIISTSPDGIMTSQFFHEMAMIGACNKGNSYALIKRDADFNPLKLIPIDNPMDVTIYVDRDYNGREKNVYYKVVGVEGWLHPYDVFHIKNTSFDGYRGASLIELARKYIYGAVAAQDYSNEIFNSGGAEKIAIETPSKLTPEAEDRLRKDWSRKYGKEAGAAKQEIAVIPAGMKVSTIGINPSDAELINSKKLTIEDFSRYSRVPLHMLNALEKSGYNSLEHMSKEFALYTMQPWFTRFQQEVNAKLLRESDKENTYCEYDSSILTKGDTTTMAELVSKCFPTGAINSDDIRELVFNMNPRPGGDTHYTAVNVQSKEHEDAKINLINSKIQENGGK